MPANGEVPQPSQKEVLTPEELKGVSGPESKSNLQPEIEGRPPNLARELHSVAGHPVLSEQKLEEVLKGGPVESRKEDAVEAPLKTLKATRAQEKTPVSPKKPESTFTAEELEAMARQGEESARAAGGSITSPEAIAQAATHALGEAEKMQDDKKEAEKQIKDALEAGKIVFEDETGRTEFKVVGERTHGGVNSLVLQFPGTGKEFLWRPGSKENLGFYTEVRERGTSPERGRPALDKVVKEITDWYAIEDLDTRFSPDTISKLNKNYAELRRYVDEYADDDPKIIEIKSKISEILPQILEDDATLDKVAEGHKLVEEREKLQKRVKQIEAAQKLYNDFHHLLPTLKTQRENLQTELKAKRNEREELEKDGKRWPTLDNQISVLNQQLLDAEMAIRRIEQEQAALTSRNRDAWEQKREENQKEKDILARSIADERGKPHPNQEAIEQLEKVLERYTKYDEFFTEQIELSELAQKPQAELEALRDQLTQQMRDNYDEYRPLEKRLELSSMRDQLDVAENHGNPEGLTDNQIKTLKNDIDNLIRQGIDPTDLTPDQARDIQEQVNEKRDLEEKYEKQLEVIRENIPPSVTELQEARTALAEKIIELRNFFRDNEQLQLRYDLDQLQKDLQQRIHEQTMDLIREFGGNISETLTEEELRRRSEAPDTLRDQDVTEQETAPKISFEELKSFKDEIADYERIQNDENATAVQKLEVRKRIEAFIYYARKHGLLGQYENHLNSKFQLITTIAQQTAMQGGMSYLEQRMQVSRDRKEFTTEEFEESEWETREDSLSDFVAKNQNKFTGIIAFYNKRGYKQLIDYCNAMGSTTRMRDREILKGEWNLKTIEESSEKARRKNLWTIYQGVYYDIKANNPQEFQETVDSFIETMIIGGGLEKNADRILQAKEYFVMAFETRLNDLRGMGSLNAEQIKELHNLKRQFEARLLLYCAEYFNRVDNADYYAQLLQVLAKDEGLDRWSNVIRTRNGKVAAMLNILDNDPRAEAFFRAHGPMGQNNGHTSSQYFLQAQVKQMFMEELIGIELNDEAYDDNGNVIKTSLNGEKGVMTPDGARRYNLSRVGLHQSQEKFGRLYQKNYHLDKLEELEEKVRKEEPMTDFELRSLKIGRLQKKIKEKKPLNSSERAFYKQLKNEAEDAFNLAMQIYSATGQKSLRGGASFIARRQETDPRIYKEKMRKVIKTKGPEGKYETHIVDVPVEIRIAEIRELGEDEEGAHFIPDWQANSFVQFADTQARVEWSQILEATHWAGLTKEERTKELGNFWKVDRDAFNKLVDFTVTPALAPDKSKELANLLHKAVLYRADLARKRAVKELDEKGFRAKIVDAKGNVIKIKTPDGEKDADFFTAVNHVFGRWTEHSYLAHQIEIRNQLVSDEIREQARQIRDGEINAEDADMLAVLRLIIDPTLNRIGAFPTDLQREERLVQAAVEQSMQVHYKIQSELLENFKGIKVQKIFYSSKDGSQILMPEETEALVDEHGLSYIIKDNEHVYIKDPQDKEFAKEHPQVLQTEINKIAWHIPNFDSVTKPLYDLGGFIDSNRDRWSRRARFMIPYLALNYSSLPNEWGQKGILGVIGMMERGSARQIISKQPLLDWIELFRFGVRAGIAQQLRYAYIGGIGSDGKEIIALFEKPTNDSDQFRLLDDVEKLDIHFSEMVSHHEKFRQTYRGTLGRLEDTCKLIRLLDTQHRSAQGALDLENVAVFDTNGEYAYSGDILPGANTSSSRHTINRLIDAYIRYVNSDEFANSYPDEAEYYRHLTKEDWDWFKGKVSR